MQNSEALSTLTPSLQAGCRLKAMGDKLSMLIGSFFIKGTSPYKLIQLPGHQLQSAMKIALFVENV